VLPSGQKLTLGLLATITFEVVPFHAYAPFPVLLPFLNVSWKLCSVKVFTIACNSSSVISVVLKIEPFSFIFNWGNRKVRWVGDDSHVVFGKKFHTEKKKCEVVHCRDATASSFIAKDRCVVFAHVTHLL
jgi:hypothetical protein